MEKLEQVSDETDLARLDQIQEVYAASKQKLVGLQKQEEEYNKNVQVIVESDEQQMQLNKAI